MATMTETSGTLRERLAATTKTMRLASREWRELIKAIRDNRAAATIKELGGAAALEGNALSGLFNAVRQLPRLETLAAAAPAATKAWDKYHAAMDDLRAQFGEAATPNSQKRIAGEIEQLLLHEAALKNAYLESTLAARQLVAIRAEYGID